MLSGHLQIAWHSATWKRILLFLGMKVVIIIIMDHFSYGVSGINSRAITSGYLQGLIYQINHQIYMPPEGQIMRSMLIRWPANIVCVAVALVVFIWWHDHNWTLKKVRRRSLPGHKKCRCLWALMKNLGQLLCSACTVDVIASFYLFHNYGFIGIIMSKSFLHLCLETYTLRRTQCTF